MTHADRLAATLGLDMAQWQPTASSFFGRIPKARILEAVTEAHSKGAADNLATLKKDVLAKRAEEMLTGTRWLPSVLRLPVSEAPARRKQPPQREGRHRLRRYSEAGDVLMGGWSGQKRGQRTHGQKAARRP